MFTWIVHVPQFKALFLSQPKVASTSLLPLLGRLAGLDLDYSTQDFRDRLPGYPLDEIHALRDHFRFGFVRNPWDRLVSCYAHTFARSRDQGHTRLPPYFRNPGCFRLDMSFTEFAEAVIDVPDHDIDPHARSQHTFFTDTAGRWLPDFVGRLENLRLDWSYACLRAGFPPLEIPHENRSSHKPYREYYDPRLRDLVAERYARDLRQLNYDF